MAVEDDLLEYFRDVVFVTAAKLQSWKEEEKVEAEGDDCDDFGAELLECTTGMSPQEVCIIKGNLTNPNNLGPLPVRISEKFRLVK